MNKFISIMLMVCLLAMNPALADHKMRQYFVAVFVSKEFTHDWAGKYKPDLLLAPDHWSQLPDFLQKVKQEAGNKPILLDMSVHGMDDGLYITTKIVKETHRKLMERTTFGYMVNQIYKYLGDRNITVLCEACYSGNAYFFTMRNNHRGPEYDCNFVPPFPVLGVGSGFSNWGETVYIQVRHNLQDTIEDLRVYETKFPKEHEPENVYDFDYQGFLSPTTEHLKQLYEFYSENVP